ncbi:MAG: hypothetical protein LBK68_06540 [Candidatus Margulisbacteria bacterium]|jgi:hypothetical protein|nr:hypothetical protein [Candidatus Margulisiibacteriota bacterium]
MVDSYTDAYTGIANREPLSAQKVTDALNQMEKMAYKVLASDKLALEYFV